MLLDRAGTIRFINKVLAPWTLGDVVGRSWLDFAQPYEHARISAILDEVLADGQPRELEQVGYGEGATPTWYASHLGPVIRDGRVTGAVLVARDMTAQREREARLRVADRLATVGTLAAGVAHGINNPLSAVVANLALVRRMLDGVPADVRADLDAALRDAGDAALRIGDVVGDLTVFVRAEDPSVGPVDPRAILESTLRLAGNEIRHRARLVRDLDEVPAVQANEGRLGQVFMNLLINAVQAMPEGRADRNVLHVTTRVAADGRVEIAIADTGVGISDEVQARLFTPFFTTRAPGESAGLGLAISQRIIASFGGVIEVESAPGAGSVFRVLLPALDAAPAPRPVAPRVATTRRRARVLVIDDERIVTDVIAKILGEDHDVVTENSATAALDRIANGERYDAILCDVMMPEVSGIDFHAGVAMLAPELLPRIAFMTGGAFTPRARQFLDRVESPVLGKPFTFEELQSVIAAQLAT
jgi:signal transduction histidine kinase